jgi:hypothetical protein
VTKRASTLQVLRTERPFEELPRGSRKTGRVFADFLVDGASLSTIVRQKADLISVLGWGSEDLQRAARDRLLLKAPPDLPSGRYALYVCPECGDLGCGAVSAIIERVGDTVVWRDFGYENNYQEGLDRRGLEPLNEYRFPWSSYEEAIRAGYGMDGFDAGGVQRKRGWWARNVSRLFRRAPA